MEKIERETIINFNDEEDFAEIYTCQQRIMKKCEKLGLKSFRTLKGSPDGHIISKAFKCPKKWIKINKPKQLSEENRKKLSDRMKEMAKKRNLQ